jgi:hypothetical protein
MKYNIKIETQPPKIHKTEEEVQSIVEKAISLIVDELIINEHLKIGE